MGAPHCTRLGPIQTLSAPSARKPCGIFANRTSVNSHQSTTSGAKRMNQTLIKYAGIVFTIGISLVVSLPLRAQVAGGTLSGTITDASGAVVPSAEVEIKNSATGITKTMTTSTEGYYTAPNLLPGNYEVAVSAPGFNTAIKNGIVINVGSQPVFNLVLEVGVVVNRVEVSTDAPTVQLTSSEISAAVNATTVRELPLNGRSWTDLAALQPGVSTIQNQPSFSSGSDRGNRGFGQQLTISGARPPQNNYRLDGISLNDYANGAPGSVLGGHLGVDAIQEFSVLTSNLSAEYGRTSGGLVNAITRSGTNQFHGNVYEFLRNSALDARNFFDGPTVPPFRRNQFGGSVGGPIVKDKTFFFFNYEGLRQSLSSTQISTVPSANARQGILSTGNVTVDPAIVPFLQFWPLPSPNLPLNTGGDTGQYRVVNKQPGTANFYTTRIDHNFSSRDTLSGSFFYDKTQLSNPDPLNVENFFNSNSRSFVSLEENHIFSSTFVNSVRFGFSRNRANVLTTPSNNPLGTDTSLGSVPGQAAPFLIVPGISVFSGGVDGFPNFTFGWNSFQGYDDAFITRGKHSIKFGLAVERMQSNNLFHFFDNGRFVFPSLSAFFPNQPIVFSATIPSSATPRAIRETLFGGYIQDDWRFRPNLTFNIGLRYEMT